MTDETTRDAIARKLMEVTSDRGQRNSIWSLDALHLADALLAGIEVPGVGVAMIGKEDSERLSWSGPGPHPHHVPLFRQVKP